LRKAVQELLKINTIENIADETLDVHIKTLFPGSVLLAESWKFDPDIMSRKS
jgi:hypothetical protein